MRQFRRAWRIQVGTMLLSQSDGRRTDGLACAFKVTRSLATSRAGSCELTVYNLSREHTAEVTALPRRRTFVSIDAGYAEGMSRLFTGDSRKIVPGIEGPITKVTVTAGDGEHARRTARVSQAFAAGTSADAAAQAIADALGVGVGNARTAFQGLRLNGHGSAVTDGTVLRGGAAAELTRITNAAGLTWSIQDGALQVLPVGGALARTAIRIGADSGMIESPTPVDRFTWTVKCLIQPGLTPGQRVVIDSRIVRAELRISEVTFAGDTEGDDWTAELTLKRLRQPLLDRSAPGVTAVDS
jgi:hypothetical protein